MSKISYVNIAGETCRCGCTQYEKCNMECSLYRKITGKQTNADCIRAMSDEELAELIAKWAFCDECVELFGYKVCETTNCSDHWLSWLKAPVEEEEG